MCVLSKAQLRIQLVLLRGGQAQHAADILLRQHPVSCHVVVGVKQRRRLFQHRAKPLGNAHCFSFRHGGTHRLSADIFLGKNRIRQAERLIGNIAGDELLVRHAHRRAVLHQREPEYAGAAADRRDLAGDKVAHGVHHGHDAPVTRGHKIVGLDRVRVRADNVVGAAVGKLLRHTAHGRAGLALILGIHSPVDIDQHKFRTGRFGRRNVRRRLFRRVFVDDCLTAQLRQAVLVSVEPGGVRQKPQPDAVDVHHSTAAGIRVREQACVHHLRRIYTRKSLPDTGDSAVNVVIVRQHQKVETRVPDSSKKFHRRVIMIFSVDLVLLTGVGRTGADHGLQIADGQIRGSKYGADELEDIVKIGLSVYAVGSVELGFRQHISHAAYNGAAGRRRRAAVRAVRLLNVAGRGVAHHRLVVGLLHLIQVDVVTFISWSHGTPPIILPGRSLDAGLLPFVAVPMRAPIDNIIAI